MFCYEILCKARWTCFGFVRFSCGKAGRIGLARWRAQMYLCAEARRQVILDIALPDVAHNGSRCSVGCLKDARPKRSLECQRREWGRSTLSSIRLPETACRSVSPHRAQRSTNGFDTTLLSRIAIYVGSRANRFAPAQFNHRTTSPLKDGHNYTPLSVETRGHCQSRRGSSGTAAQGADAHLAKLECNALNSEQN